MVFGKKKKKVKVPEFEEDFEEEEEETEQEVPEIEPPKSKRKAIAIIKKAQETEDGIFHYVIETNYPLGLGVCELTQ